MAPSSGTYSIGPKDGTLKVCTAKSGVGAKMAHNLVMEARTWSATVNYSADDISASTVEATIDPTSLEIVEATGGVKPLSDSDRKDIAKNINDKALQTKKHPEISFRSSGVTGTPPSVALSGDLTIVGVTKPVTVAVTLNDDGVSAEATVVQTDYGIKPYSAMLGALKVADAVEIAVTVNLPG